MLTTRDQAEAGKVVRNKWGIAPMEKKKFNKLVKSIKLRKKGRT